VQGMTVQEKRIAHEIEEQGKGCIVLFNKWDLVKGFRMEHCKKSFEIDIPFFTHCPLLFVSGKSGRNLDGLFAFVKQVHEEQNRRITTGQLNKFLEKVVQKYHPPMIDGKRLRIFYMAQVDVTPPRFVLFVNNPELMVDSYKKYLLNQFREAYSFTGAPIVFILKARTQRQDGGKSQKHSVEIPSEEDVEEEDVCEESDLDPSYFA
jgi:GTP-binding protein